MTRRRRLVFACVPAFAALLGAELWVRVTRPHEDLWVLTGRRPGPSPLAAWAQADAFCAYRPRPGRQPVRSGWKTVNRHGFFSTPEVDIEKPPGTYRIAFLGESSTAGTGYDLADEETWPWKVVESLRASDALPGHSFEFINGAAGGYTLFESLGRLTHRIRFFRPDMVVVYHGWNEMYYFDEADRTRRWRVLDDGSWSLGWTSLAQVEPTSIDWLIRPSQLLTKIRKRLGRRGEGEVGAARPLLGDFDQRSVEVWRQNLRLIMSACESLGVELLVCKQATLIVPGLGAADRARCRYEYHGFDHDAHVRAFDAVYRVIDEEVPASRIIDVRSVSGVAENFADHIHPTELGATRIATVVAEGIRAALRAR